jgi:hypothetical protein
MDNTEAWATQHSVQDKQNIEKYIKGERWHHYVYIHRRVWHFSYTLPDMYEYIACEDTYL